MLCMWELNINFIGKSHFCSILYEDRNYITMCFTFLVSVLVSIEASVYTGDKHWNQVEDVCSGRVIPNQIKNNL